VYGDNRDLPVKDLATKEKYHPHIDTTVMAFFKWFPSVGTVLDVGSRDGYAVEALGSHGYVATGLELVPEYVDYAQAHQRNVVQGDILGPPVEAESFDYIFSRHCVEHCKSTGRFLDACWSILVPGGGLFLTFPLETTKEWRHRKKNDHLVHFEHKAEFRGMALAAGFKESFFGKSKSQGIIPNGKEVCYVGVKCGL
jgi:SAM-dependent methyltransferase